MNSVRPAAPVCEFYSQNSFFFIDGFPYLMQIFRFCYKWSMVTTISCLSIYIINKIFPTFVQQHPIRGENLLGGCFQKTCSLEALRIYGNGLHSLRSVQTFLCWTKKHEFSLSIVGNKTKAMNFFMSSDFVQLSS